MEFFILEHRGINSQTKWDAIHSKIVEACSSIVCLQETKCSVFDENYLKHFCPRNLRNFAFSASIGASGA
jgi:hypothetical protein